VFNFKQNIFVLSIKFLCLNFSIPQKKILIFIKKNFEEKSSLNHYITKEKDQKKTHTHPLSPKTPSHTTKRIIPWNLF
jgi:hypothetical protein